MTIDELKNNGNSQVKEEPFVPTIEQEGDDKFIPSIETGEPQVQATPKKNSFSMVGGNSRPVKPVAEERTKADFSDLPADNMGDAGITQKVSIEEEILGPGGDFEKYLAEQRAEAQAYLQEYELRHEMGEIEDSSEASVDISDEDEIEKELAEESAGVPVVSRSFDTENTVETEEVVEEVEVVKSVINSPVPDDENIDSELEISESDDIEEEGMTDEQRVEIMKAMITERLRPVSKRLDLKSFTIAKKGTANMNVFAASEISAARWVLYNTGVSVDMKEMAGSTLDKLRGFANMGDPRGVLNVIYENIVSPKVASFEGWAKTVAYGDYDHLFMAVYAASFADSNYLPGDCENKQCKEKMYVTDNIPLMDMVEFKNADARAKFNRIMKETPVNTSGAFAAEVVPISDQCAIALRIPSLYSAIIEPSYLDDSFTEKYRDMVALLPYVSEIYKIDYESKSLIPIEYKVYANNTAKTIKSKVIYYNKALASLSPDEITILKAYINAINQKEDDVTYKIPETTCPHCGHQNPAQLNQSASSLVFLRNQLALLVTT